MMCKAGGGEGGGGGGGAGGDGRGGGGGLTHCSVLLVNSYKVNSFPSSLSTRKSVDI